MEYKFSNKWGRRGNEHMLFGFTTTYAISAYHSLKLAVRIPLISKCTQCNIRW